MTNQQEAPPDHVEDAGQAIARLHDQHRDRATSAERASAYLTAVLASPCFIAVCVLLVLGWVAMNGMAPRFGWSTPDPPPFNLLQGVATLMAVFATLLILATQRREDQIAAQREQLGLHLAILNDRKLAKLISLMEELRRDDPMLRDRPDPEAEALAEPAAPRVVMDALASNEGPEKPGSPPLDPAGA